MIHSAVRNLLPCSSSTVKSFTFRKQPSTLPKKKSIFTQYYNKRFIIHSLNSFDREIEKLMASKQGPIFDHSDSYGTTWADQWDYSEDRSLKEGNSNKKMTEKVKSAASTGFDKTKVAAAIGAKKIKEGSSTGIRWIKVQYQKRSKK